MKLTTRIDRETLRNHLQYNLWKYALAVIASIFLWDFIYAYTAYRPPQGKRIDIYIQSATTTQEAADAWFEEIRQKAVPDMELVSSVLLMGTTQTDVYAAQQLTTYIMAREGDLYFLTGADFKRFASQGVFVDLEPFINDGSLRADGLDLRSGYVAMQEYDSQKEEMVQVSSQRLFGIPASELYGFMGLGIDNRDLYLCMTIFNQNDDNVLKFLDELIDSARAQRPEFLEKEGAGQ